jgi:uncharacterized repeat protein (TIGR03803 family)
MVALEAFKLPRFLASLLAAGLIAGCSSGASTLPKSDVQLPDSAVKSAMVPQSIGREDALHIFHGPDGGQSTANLIADAEGNFYGTAISGGAGNAGVVFELSPSSGGKWKETVLYSFSGFKDGNSPFAGLTMDAAGNLYGTTSSGGDPSCTASAGACGVVYELSRVGSKWKETVLHAFEGSDGAYPVSGVTLDKAGDVFGATEQGGGTTSYCGGGCGVAYELVPSGKGKWTESVLHAFNPFQPPDGQFPESRMIFDANGDLFGTTFSGQGPTSSGTVYELVPTGSGQWKESILHEFSPQNNSDGQFPSGDLVMDPSGDLLGTTSEGGDSISESAGVVFMLEAGSWSENVLFSFNNIVEGLKPEGGVILDHAGNLYGTTEVGGHVGCPNNYTGCGNVFRLSKSGKETTVALSSTKGYHPVAGLAFDAKGNLYGTTRDGGDLKACVGYGGCGSVFEILTK